MSSAAAILSANVNSGRVSDTKSADTQVAEQPFGHVLAQEVARQDGGERARETADAGTTIPESDAQGESFSEPVAQDSSLLPWLALLSQQATVIPAREATVVQPAVDGLQSGSSQPVAAASLPLLGGVEKLVAGVSGEAVLAAGSDGKLPDMAETREMPAASAAEALAASPATDTGKALPEDALFSLEKTDLTEQLLGSADSKETTPDAAWLASVASREAPVQSSLSSWSGAESVSKTATQHVVHEPVGDTRWGEVVAQRVSMMLGKQEQQVEMQLTPPNLGPMEVRLTLGQEQASVVFASQHAAVREALATAVPRLTALLADQGIQLVNVQVASDSLQQQAQNPSSQQQSFSFSGHNQGARSEPLFPSDASVSRSLGELALPVARSGVSLYV